MPRFGICNLLRKIIIVKKILSILQKFFRCTVGKSSRFRFPCDLYKRTILVAEFSLKLEQMLPQPNSKQPRFRPEDKSFQVSLHIFCFVTIFKH